MGNKAVKFKDGSGNVIYPCPYYPVGSIYMSVNNINPTNFFGGTWEQIKDKFLLCAGSTYIGGGTGGSTTTNSHTLATDEIPSHNHGVTVKSTSLTGDLNSLYGSVGVSPLRSNAKVSGVFSRNSTSIKNSPGYVETAGYGLHIDVSHNHSASSSYTGGGKGHSHTYMPPYLAVYVWKRTA